MNYYLEKEKLEDIKKIIGVICRRREKDNG